VSPERRRPPRDPGDSREGAGHPARDPGDSRGHTPPRSGRGGRRAAATRPGGDARRRPTAATPGDDGRSAAGGPARQGEARRDREGRSAPTARRERGAPSARAGRQPRAEADSPTFLAMIGVVAVVVAAVIVVFFVIGYILGRLFL
jgi:hypothetical protein